VGDLLGHSDSVKTGRKREVQPTTSGDERAMNDAHHGNYFLKMTNGTDKQRQPVWEYT
jgi:hypothetical protein